MDANKDVLAQSNLLTAEAQAAKIDDLIIVIKAADESAAQVALSQVDALIARRSAGNSDSGIQYRPKTIESALQMLPDAGWVLV